MTALPPPGTADLDALRDEMTEALVGMATYSTTQRVLDALLPVVERLVRETAGKALRDAAADAEAPIWDAWLRARADAADGGTT